MHLYKYLGKVSAVLLAALAKMGGGGNHPSPQADMGEKFMFLKGMPLSQWNGIQKVIRLCFRMMFPMALHSAIKNDDVA